MTPSGSRQCVDEAKNARERCVGLEEVLSVKDAEIDERERENAKLLFLMGRLRAPPVSANERDG